MGIMRSEDQGVTTLAVDIGLDSIVAVWVHKPIDEVEKILVAGGFVAGDSTLGEVRVQQTEVKFMQAGEREINPVASARPSGAPLGL